MRFVAGLLAAGMIARAEPFLVTLAARNHLAQDFTKETSEINETNLTDYQVFIQLHPRTALPLSNLERKK
jgi:hypothetical protein